MLRTLQVILLVSGLLFMSGSFGNISDARTLRFYHTHTGHSLEVTYYARGSYDRGALQDLPSGRFVRVWLRIRGGGARR